jgi:asparagine synthetase B (glutamine-hydrolysing)
MAGILIAVGKDISNKYSELYNEFVKNKNIKNSHNTTNDYYRISKFSRVDESDENILVSRDISLFCVGTIFCNYLTGKKVLEYIKIKLLENDLQSIINSLDGHFVLIAVCHNKKIMQIITDHAGIIHLYFLRDGENQYFSTSSRIFSRNFDVSINVDAVAQFLRCDSICDSDTIYSEINVLEAAAIYTIEIDNPRNNRKEIYWKSPISIEEDMNIEDATDLWSKTLLEIGKIITSGNIICDLTGGFDTRSILAAILPYVEINNKKFSTFVFGPDESTEVKVAKQISTKLNLNILHTTLPDDWEHLISDYLKQALNYTDGEENIIGFASMLFANQVKKKNFNTSINGMSGGCVRPFFWVQEITYGKKPANIVRFLNMRAFQYEYDYSVFSNEWRNQINSIPELLTRRYLNSIADMDLNNSYNTLQLDNIDLRQRERRWGGRTISSSNQIIKIISPLYFKKCMDIGLKIPPKFKVRDLLNRKVITKLNPKLAKQKMITGVPCEEISIKNFFKFYPLLAVYSTKLAKVFSQQIIGRSAFIDSSLSYSKHDWFKALLSDSGNNDLGNIENWITRKIYDTKVVKEFIEKAKHPGFRYYGQLEKMITLEFRLREDRVDYKGLG